MPASAQGNWVKPKPDTPAAEAGFRRLLWPVLAVGKNPQSPKATVQPRRHRAIESTKISCHVAISLLQQQNMANVSATAANRCFSKLQAGIRKNVAAEIFEDGEALAEPLYSLC